MRVGHISIARRYNYEERTSRLFAGNETVRSYRTIVVLDPVKVFTDMSI